MSSKRDYYEVLELSRGASAEDIKRAYRRLARKYHPDVNQDGGAENLFKEINEAYKVLSDPQKRRVYDQLGHQGLDGRSSGSGFGFEGFDFGGIGDIFDMFFGGGTRTTDRRNVGQAGADLRYDLEVTLEEVADGAMKTLKMSRLAACEACGGSGAAAGTSPETCHYCGGTGQVRHSQQTILGSFSTLSTCSVCHGEGRVIKEPCPKCGGQGRHRRTSERTIEIPKGIEHGTRIRLRSHGDAGAKGGRPGDLYIFVYVKPHKLFERQGRDIVCEIRINFVQAALGDTIKVPALKGTEKLTVPAGTQSGTAFKLRGKGLPDVNSGKPGDENIIVRVMIPEKLNDEQRKLLAEFARASGIELDHPEGKGFLEKLLRK